jgi:hypothetical protein
MAREALEPTPRLDAVSGDIGAPRSREPFQQTEHVGFVLADTDPSARYSQLYLGRSMFDHQIDWTKGVGECVAHEVRGK